MSSGRQIVGLVDMAVALMGRAQKTHPTGDPKFSVMQAFPATVAAAESDPFLMCDHFGPTLSKGVAKHPDEFPIPWHPHRGMDILTYLTRGVGRHGDSLGNREEFATPGMQWISVGSGIEHAEGGGTPAGQMMEGFQIWVNVPSDRKMDDPRYGTEAPESIPNIDYGGVSARLLAGSLGGHKGPFNTVQPVQIVDFCLDPNRKHRHEIPAELDNAILYVSQGAGSINGVSVDQHGVVRLDASDPKLRGVTLAASGSGFNVICFAGKRLNQPIAWHGPFVMTTQEEIRQTLSEYRNGAFLRKRAAWDYKDISTKLA